VIYFSDNETAEVVKDLTFNGPNNYFIPCLL